MKVCWNLGKAESLAQGVVVITLAVVLGWSVAQGEEKANVTVWDTGSRFADVIDVGERASWKVVPSDLLMLEADPRKASSDPGYYGREYAFEGDAVIEAGGLIAISWSARGSVVFYSKVAPNLKVVELVPFETKAERAGIVRCEILRNTGDEAALKIFLSAPGEQDLSYVLALDRSKVAEIKPSQHMNRMRLRCPIEYGVVPSFIGDDLIYGTGRYPSSMNTLCIPSENLFLGLLHGQSSILVITWPEGKQRIGLGLSSKEQASPFIESVDFENPGQSIYIALLEAPAIWHKEKLTSSYLEKDVVMGWKRPFPAKWITQLFEGDVKTTFAFRESQGQIWRGVAGMYSYPVWFDGDSAFCHLSKKVPPSGESVVYFLEGKNTPVSVSTPVDIMRATLGREVSDRILDLPGRMLRTHHRRGATGIRRACTCGCTEAIEAVFKVGQESEKSEYVEGAAADMLYFVRRHMERIDEYRAFANDMIRFLQTAAQSSAKCKPLLDGLEQIVQQIPQEYDAQKENIKSLAYAEELARETTALIGKKSAQNLSTCLDLCKKWRGMGGAQDGLLAQYHIIVRKLFQEAGYGCADRPDAVELAQEIRKQCRQCLRNPDGYEIWPDY